MQYYFITGTSSGIGKALAEQLVQREDAYLYGISRTSVIHHERYEHVFADLSNINQLHKIEYLFNRAYLPADSVYLINNAGIIEPIRYAGDFSHNDIQTIIQVNLIAALQLMNAFLKIPETAVQKRVMLSVSSGAATKVVDGWSLYGASKAAIDHFSVHVAKELEIRRIPHTYVFSVAPGVVDTPMQAKIRNTSEAHFSTVERFNILHKDKQLISPQAIAAKYLQVLDQPTNYPDILFSLRDIN